MVPHVTEIGEDFRCILHYYITLLDHKHIADLDRTNILLKSRKRFSNS